MARGRRRRARVVAAALLAAGAVAMTAGPAAAGAPSGHEGGAAGAGAAARPPAGAVAGGAAAGAGPTAAARLPPGQPFSFAWGGDVTLGSSYGDPPNQARGLLAAVAPELRASDLAAVNLEGTLGSGGPNKCGGSDSGDCFAFQAPAANAVALRAAGLDVVNLANNHAFDFGASGQAQTVAAVHGQGVAETGRPGEITVLSLPHAKVAFLGFSAYPWTSPIRDLAVARAQIARATKLANVVVVFVHAGAEGADKTHTPYGDEIAYGENRGNVRAFAHAAVAAGADLVVGSGPHVLRGAELDHGRLIAYSLGNLAGYRNFGIGPVTGTSALLQVQLAANGAFVAGTLTSLRLSPVGIPALDPADGGAKLVSRLSREDFGSAGITVAGAQIVPHAGYAPPPRPRAHADAPNA